MEIAEARERYAALKEKIDYHNHLYYDCLLYTSIDNIPANLLAKLMEFAQQSENTLERVAVVLDIRGGKSSEDILNALGQLKAGRVNYKILFLDARNDVLERRYKETRRRHPISIASKVSTDEAILQRYV